MRLVEDDDGIGPVDLRQGVGPRIRIEQVVVGEEHDLGRRQVVAGQVEGTYLAIRSQGQKFLHVQYRLMTGRSSVVASRSTTAIAPITTTSTSATGTRLIVGDPKSVQIVPKAALALLVEAVAAGIDVGTGRRLGLDLGMDAQLLSAAQDGISRPISGRTQFSHHLRQLRVRPGRIEYDRCSVALLLLLLLLLLLTQLAGTPQLTPTNTGAAQFGRPAALPRQRTAQQAQGFAGTRRRFQQRILPPMQRGQDRRHVLPLTVVRAEGEVDRRARQVDGGGRGCR